jgi:dipeptidyl aminopeptidase/acylaminoacyl peptidase
MKKAIIIIGILILILLLPYVIKDRSYRSTNGPELSELKYSEIVFPNNYENIKLGGMLFLPEAKDTFPIAVIIHGSGSSRRNNKWYLSTVSHLQRNGIAVLLPDKRGCEKSEGAWIGSDFEQLATDTKSAVDYIINESNLHYSKIGLVGMSQGGWIAPIVATESSDISFIVSMSGASVTTDEQLDFEMVYNIEPYTYKFLARLIAPISVRQIKNKDYYSPIAGFDPIPYWKQIRIPVFFAFGGNDTNLPVDDCIKRLKAHNLEHFKIKTYPNGGHGILDPETYKVNQEFLNDLDDFINETNI